MCRRIALAALVLVLPALYAGAPQTPREALQPFNDLIGTWRGTGAPFGSRAEQQQGFWVETLAWEWQFQGKDAWLKAAFDKSKHFKDAELRPLSGRGAYALKVRAVSGETLDFTGRLDKRVLTLERETKDETQRLVVTLLHSNRFLYRYEVRPAGKTLFARKYQVGATKEGEPFAAGDGRPECVVSGGLGTSPVMYQGKTYYVCCSGCRAEFQDNPAKYIMEFEAKKKK